MLNTIHIPKSDREVLGQILLKKKLVSQEKLAIALQTMNVTKERIGETLSRLGIVTEFDIAVELANQLDIEFCDVDTIASPSVRVLSTFTKNFCINNGFLPLSMDGSSITVVVGNADPELVRQQVLQHTNLVCQVKQGEFSKVKQAVHYYYHFMDNPVEVLFEKEIKKLQDDVDQVRSPDELIGHLLHLAVKYKASDIHIQPEAKSIRIAFRIDGVVRSIVALPTSLKRMGVAIKILANMDTSDTFRPQDGSFSTTILEMPYDVRISIVITEFGEYMVMRMLPSGVHVKGLTQLGFEQQDLERVQTMFTQPHGIMLMTGPTGSGKSTTLHAGIRCDGLENKNIISVEDPIEYKLPIINQTQVNRKANYQFDTAIRHFLRHDPDVMIVGEIRDSETAKAAVTAAETGHLVLSTLHTNDVLGVLSRLAALGVDSQVVSETLVGVINQRLARKICNHCREEFEPTERELHHFSRPIAKLYRGKGCPECLHTGYSGRFPLYEILTMTPELGKALEQNAHRHQLLEIMIKSGYVSLEQLAMKRVREGIACIEEMKRLLGAMIKEAE